MIAKIKCTKIKWTKILLWCRACDVMELEEFRVDISARGYHIYKDIWYVLVGKVLVCEMEPNNSQDISQDKNSTRLIFMHNATHENILTTKITQTTVVT